MDLLRVAEDVANAIVDIDASLVPFKQFQPGVGPYGEPQLVRAVVERLNKLPLYAGKVSTHRTPDALIAGRWALEFKLARPFGDNGKEAENWSQNLLHPYRVRPQFGFGRVPAPNSARGISRAFIPGHSLNTASRGWDAR